MRLMKRTTQQHTDVLKTLVPSLLEIIFTLSRFIGLKILMCVFNLVWHACPVPLVSLLLGL